jgi:hypothetical protein
MESNVSESLKRAAHRAGLQPFFLGSVLAEYQAANNLDDSKLAEALGCAIADLPRLALCRRPATEQTNFVADLGHLEQRFKLNGGQLATIIREVDALAALRHQLNANAAAPGLLRAARDRDEHDEVGEEGRDG